ncbi:flagellar export protein FliJ [Bradyrhizobium sp. AZCC 1693]
MKSRETLIRLKKFQVDEKRRRVTQIEGMIADFQRMSVDLEREIQTEQERAGINDPSHFAYPTYAKAAIQRRENLTRSADELRIQLEDAKSLLSEAFEELKKVELLDERDQARERAEESAPGAGRHGLHRADARPAWRRLTLLALIGCTIKARAARRPGFFLSNRPESADLVAPVTQGMVRNFSIAPA